MSMRRFPLSDAHTVLDELGLRGASGLRKVQQLEHLLPWLLDEVGNFENRPLIEFACGKGYVSFAFRYAAQQMGIGDVPIIGLDCSDSMIALCEAIRDRLGWSNMDFRFVKRGQVPADLPSPHVVVSLHACDTATDQAIATGIYLKANLLLHVPCCHSTVQRMLRVAGRRHALGYICRSFPVLGEALSQLLTEGIRCTQMRTFGYQTIIREFVSPLATPKNLLIIGRLRTKPNRRAAQESASLSEEYGIPLLITQMLNGSAVLNLIEEAFHLATPSCSASEASRRTRLPSPARTSRSARSSPVGAGVGLLYPGMNGGVALRIPGSATASVTCGSGVQLPNERRGGTITNPPRPRRKRCHPPSPGLRCTRAAALHITETFGAPTPVTQRRTPKTQHRPPTPPCPGRPGC